MNDNLKTSIDVDATSASILLPNDIRLNVSSINMLRTASYSNNIVVKEEGESALISAITHDNQFVINIEAKDSEIKVENNNLISILKENRVAAYIEVPVLYNTATDTAIDYDVEVEEDNIMFNIKKDVLEAKAEIRIGSQSYSSKMALIDKFKGIEYWYDMLDNTIYKTDNINQGRESYFVMPEGYTSSYGYTIPRMISETKLLYGDGYSNIKEYEIKDNILQEVNTYDCNLIVKVSNSYWIGIKKNADYSINTPEAFAIDYKLMKYNGTSFDVLDAYKLIPKTTMAPSICYLIPTIAQETSNEITISLVSRSIYTYFNDNVYLSLIIDKNKNTFTVEGVNPGESIIFKNNIHEVKINAFERKTYINGVAILEAAISNSGTAVFNVLASNENTLLTTEVSSFNFYGTTNIIFNISEQTSTSASIPKKNQFSVHPIYISMCTLYKGYYTYLKTNVDREIRQLTRDDIVELKNAITNDDYFFFRAQEGYVDINIKGIPKDIRFFGDTFTQEYTDYDFCIGMVGDNRYDPLQLISNNSTENLRIISPEGREDTFYYKYHYLLFEPSDAETVYVSTVFDTSRRVIKNITKSSDLTRRVSSRKTFYNDLNRRISSRISSLADILRKVVKIDRTTVRIDTVRQVINPYSTSFDIERAIIKDYIKRSRTIRKLEKSAINFIDAKRSIYKQYDNQSDLNRVVTLPATATAPTVRAINNTFKTYADTKREVDKFYNLDKSFDSLRPVIKKIEIKSDAIRVVDKAIKAVLKADTNRQVVKDITESFDLTRKTSSSIQSYIDTDRQAVNIITNNNDLERSIFKIMTVEADIERQIIKSVILNSDTGRNAYIELERKSDIEREVVKSTESLIDTLREVIKEDRVVAEADLIRRVETKGAIATDLCRNVVKNYISIIDTEREAIKTVELSNDLERKLIKSLIAYFDTLRDVEADIETIRPTLDIELELSKGVLNVIGQKYYKTEVEEE